MLEKELINLLGEKIIELNKIKVVLLALWKYDLNPEANKIIEEFEKELETKVEETKEIPVEIPIEEVKIEEVKDGWN